VTHRVLRRGARLIVPLPLPRDEYMQDFQSEESKREFLDLLTAATRSSSCRRSRRAARRTRPPPLCARPLRRADRRLGRQAGQGVGGTAEIVAEARRRKLPMAWVHAGNRKAGTNEPTSLGAEQGVVTFENFPGHAQRRRDARG